MKLRFFPKDQKFFKLFRQDAANLKVGILALQELVNNYEESCWRRAWHPAGSNLRSPKAF